LSSTTISVSMGKLRHHPRMSLGQNQFTPATTALPSWARALLGFGGHGSALLIFARITTMRRLARRKALLRNASP